MTDRTTDRLAVHDVMHRYALAIDSKDWPGLAAVFDATVTANFCSFGAREVFEGPAAGWVEQVRGTIEGMDATQHTMSNHLYQIAAGTATGSTYIQARHVCRNDRGGDTYTIGGHYHVEMRHVRGHWRIRSYTLQCTWHDGNRHVLKAAARRATGR